MTDMHEAVIEAAVNTGFDPGDDAVEDWITQRYDGYQCLTHGGGILGFTHADGEIALHHLTYNGIQVTEARFTLNSAGLAMFEVVVKSIQSRNQGANPNPMPITLQLNQHQAERLTEILDQSFATSVNHLVSSVEAQVANPEGEWAKSAPRLADLVETDRKLKLLLSRAINGDDS